MRGKVYREHRFNSGRVAPKTLTTCFRSRKGSEVDDQQLHSARVRSGAAQVCSPTTDRHSPAAAGGRGQSLKALRRHYRHLSHSRIFFLVTGNFDLFGEPVIGLDHDGDRRRHIKTTKNANKVKELAKSGLSRIEIAKAIGIATSTLYCLYFPELKVRRGFPGRHRFTPTDAARRQIAAMRRGGALQRDIAKALGISEPTLRRHFPRP